jgi:nucleotide-binding universal stress UspA family protein
MKKIVVPVDFTSSSAAALRFAALLSAATGLSISALFVYNTMVGTSWVVSAKQRERERRQMEGQLRSFVSRHTKSTSLLPPIEMCVAEGVPPLYIKWRSLDKEVALIVMGGAGTGDGKQRDLYGGIASLTAKEGGCPVVLIPEDFGEEAMQETAALFGCMGQVRQRESDRAAESV